MLMAASVTKQGLGIGRNVHHEHMADPPLGAQAADLRRDAAHQFIGVKAALHQHLAPGRVDQLDALGGRRLAVGRVDDLEAGDVEPVFAGRVPDLRFRSDQDRPDDPGCRAVDGAAQRGLVAGMHDDSRHRRHGLGR